MNFSEMNRLRNSSALAGWMDRCVVFVCEHCMKYLRVTKQRLCQKTQTIPCWVQSSMFSFHNQNIHWKLFDRVSEWFIHPPMFWVYPSSYVMGAEMLNVHEILNVYVKLSKYLNWDTNFPKFIKIYEISSSILGSRILTVSVISILLPFWSLWGRMIGFRWLICGAFHFIYMKPIRD